LKNGKAFVSSPHLFIDDPYFFYLPDEKIAPASPLPGFIFYHISTSKKFNLKIE